ncbi:MAG: (2Fe-2S)-binding protein [Lachnospiraceae bacterium]
MIRFELNGIEVESSAEPTARLLDVIRNEFGLTGPKEGCGEGECGACAILLNGNVADSCITVLGTAAGQKIVTIEGFRETKKYKLIEQCYSDAGAVQCGFCIPGMIMATESLLNSNSHPTEEEVREGISGNLCRCTGYNMIVDAVLLAAERGNGLW